MNERIVADDAPAPAPVSLKQLAANRVLERFLGGVQTAVEESGELGRAALQIFERCFGGKPNPLTRALQDLIKKKCFLQNEPKWKHSKVVQTEPLMTVSLIQTCRETNPSWDCPKWPKPSQTPARQFLIYPFQTHGRVTPHSEGPFRRVVCPS